MSRLVKLPSGTVIDLDRIVFTIKDSTRIGQILPVMAGVGDAMPILTESDVDVLVQEGYIQVPGRVRIT